MCERLILIIVSRNSKEKYTVLHNLKPISSLRKKINIVFYS